MNDLHTRTRLLHVGAPAHSADTGTAPVSVPVVRTSTVRFEDMDAFDDVHRRRAAGERIASYGRQGMDTHKALEDAINELEGASRTLLVPSGLASVSYALLSLLSPGDHLLVTDSVYSPVRRIQSALLDRFGVQVSYFSASDELASHLRPNTKVLYAESPSSLLFEVLDLPELIEQAANAHLTVVVDNTWGSGYLYRPLSLGADVSVIAGTKYLGGHSDLMLGAVAVRDPDLAARVAHANEALGLTVGADDAWLALRGIRTLPVRMAQHGLNAALVARHLEQHSEVSRVYYPALESDPGHEVWKRDFSGANGLLSVEFSRLDARGARAFVDGLRHFAIGASWGGYESLALLVDPKRLVEHSYWTGGNRPVVRLHVGLEDPSDLIADIDHAIAYASNGY